MWKCSCLENPRDGGAWWAAVYGVAKSRTQLKQLSCSSSSSSSSNDVWCWTSFHSLLAIHVFYSVRSMLRSFAYFFIRLFSCYWVLRVLCIFWMTVIYQMLSFEIFCPVCGLPSHFFDIVTEVFNFNEVQLINSFFHGSCLWCCTWKVITILKVI